MKLAKTLMKNVRASLTLQADSFALALGFPLNHWHLSRDQQVFDMASPVSIWRGRMEVYEGGARCPLYQQQKLGTRTE
jgi:hypothetical protein